MTFSQSATLCQDRVRPSKGEEDCGETLSKLFPAICFESPTVHTLGLGIIKQRKGEYEQSIRILSEGVKYFPERGDLKRESLGNQLHEPARFSGSLGLFCKVPWIEDGEYLDDPMPGSMGAS